MTSGEMPQAMPSTGWPTLGEAERAALRELLIRGPRSRAEIARLLGLSRTSLTRVTRRLVDEGLLTEGAAEQRSRTGRPGEMLLVRHDAAHFLGIKLTGDHLFAAVTDLGARTVATLDEPLADRTVEHTVAHIVRVAERLSEQFGDLAATGICLAGDIGVVEGHQVVLESHFLDWRDVPLTDLLSGLVPMPVTVENDVRALTATEHWFGAGAGCESLAVITVGVGVGFGFVVDGRVVTGHRGRAGRIDHLVIDPGGPICECGHRGCASAYLASENIVQSLRAPQAVDYEHAVALARSGDPAAVRAFDDAGRALGVLIGTVVNMIDPQKLVLTGDGLPVMELAGDRVRSAIEATQTGGTSPAPLDVQPFEFTEWARAGAVLGIRTILDF